MYGPIVLAGRMGTQGLAPGAQLIVNERESGEHAQRRGEDSEVVKAARRTGARTSGARTGTSSNFAPRASMAAPAVDLVPWFRVTHERYNLYWQRNSA